MNYLLDTNACIALIKGKPPSVRAKFKRVTDAGAQVFVSSVALFELWYGVAKSSRRDFNKNRLETFLAGPIHPLSFEDGDTKFAGAIRAELEAAGKPIGAYDVLIAGQAMRNKLTLITANISEFGRIKGLEWTDWGRS
ncbi:MAG: type II toxin-antitoxin system VapC family toxin [Candidatus Acidiferrum sp.]